MRTISANTMDGLDLDRVINARITVRDELLRFDEVTLNDSAVSSATFYRSTVSSGTFIRCAVVSNTIWLSYGSPSSLSAWASTGISVKSGSGIGMYDTKLWYQDASGNMQERTWGGSSYGGATQRTPTGWSTSLTANFAGVDTDEVYILQEEFNLDGDNNPIYHSHILYYTPTGPFTYQHPGEHYDKTSTIQHFHATRASHPFGWYKDYIFLATNDGKKAIFMQRDTRNWSVMQDVMPLDIVDDTSQFMIGGVYWYYDTIWISGRMTRSVGADLQIYMRVQYNDWVPHFTIGRDMFICEHTGTIDNIGMTMYWDGTYMWGIGLNNRWRANGTNVFFGYDPAAKKTTITGVESLSMSCSHNGETNLSLQIDPAEDDALLDHGAMLDLEIAYDTDYSSMGQFIITDVKRPRDGTGEQLVVHAMDEVAYRLVAWANDADYDYWAPHKLATYGKDRSKILRGQGDWEETGANGLQNTSPVPYYTTTNKIHSLLTHLERPENNGFIIAKFTPDPDATGRVYQEFGVVTGFYTESRAEAEERGASLSFASYGTELFGALYGEKAYNGNQGIGLYKYMPFGKLSDGAKTWGTVYQQFLDGASVTHNNPFWIAMRYTDQEIVVYTREDTATAWTKQIEHRYVYDIHYPYYNMENRGRSGVWLGRPSQFFQVEPFTRDSLYIGYTVAPTGGVPTTDTLVIEDEHITYNGHDSNANNSNAYNNYFYKDGYTDPDAEKVGPTGPFEGYEIYFTTNDPGTQSQNYYDDMVVVVTDGPGKGNVWKITDYDYSAPKQWVDTGGPYTYPETWRDHVGDATYGSWQTITGLRRVFVLEDPGHYLGEGSKLGFYHRLDITARGVDDTIVSSHDANYALFHRTDLPIVENIISHGGSPDLTFDEVAHSLARRAGVMDIEFEVEDSETSTHIFTGTGWSISTDHGTWWRQGKDSHIRIVPTTALTPGAIGIATLPETLDSSSTGHICVVDSQYVYYYNYGPSSAITLVQRMEHLRYTGSYPTIEFFTNNDFLSVYLSGALVFAVPMSDQQKGISVVAYDPVSAKIRWSALDTHVDNYICDMGATGWDNINRLIGEKHINIQHDQGVLKFLVSRTTINSGSPWTLAITGEDDDDESSLVTRLRMEGVDLFEYTDFTNLKQYGNLFRVANSEEINDAADLEIEAQRIVTDENKRINITTLRGAADPRVEPDDIINVTFTGSNRTATRDIIVESVGFGMDIDENGAEFDMHIEGYDA